MTEEKIPEPEIEKRESILALAWIPMHFLVLPLLVPLILPEDMLNDSALNMVIYLLGTGYMLAFLGKFLRRDFDPLCDRPFFCIIQAAGSAIATYAFNIPVALLLLLVLGNMNPNNEAVADVVAENSGTATAMAVFLAPIVEELMFRAGVFATLRKKNRTAAYILTIALFSLGHVFRYVSADPLYFVYVLQYIPVSWLLCRCYEKTGTIWTPIFLHMIVNAVSVSAMSALGM